MNTVILFLLNKTIRNNQNKLFHPEFVIMILGIAISVTVVSTAVNLFEGYQRSLKKILLDSSAHLFIYSDTSQLLSEKEAGFAIENLRTQPEIKSIQPVFSNSAMVQAGNSVRGCLVRAYKPEQNTEPLWFEPYLAQGKAKLETGSLVIGSRLADDLSLGIGDSLTVLYPQTDKFSPLGLISRQQTFRIMGTVRTGYYEMDRSLLLMTMTDARDFYQTGAEYTYLEVTLRDKYVDRAHLVALKFRRQLGTAYQLHSWEEFNGNLMALISIEKWLIFLVFTFLVLIAALNSISTVSTSILERKKDIALLKTMGLANITIRQFIYLRMLLISVASILTGLISGVLFAWIITQQHFYQLKGDVYFIDILTMHISPLNYLIIFCTALFIIAVCIRFPLKYIDKLQIIDVLRGN